MTHTGLVDQFGLVFIKNDDELFLSTSGVGNCFPTVTPAPWRIGSNECYRR